MRVRVRTWTCAKHRCLKREEVKEISQKVIPEFADLRMVKLYPIPWDPVPWYLVSKVLDEKKLATLAKLRMEFSQKALDAQLKFNEQIVQIQKDFQKEVSHLFG